MDIFRLEFRERHIIVPQFGATLAVGIVLPRAATIILDIGKLCRNTHTHTKLRNKRDVFCCGLIVGLNLYLALFKEFVSQGIAGPNRESAVDGDGDRMGIFARLDRADGTLSGSIAPYSETLCEVCSVLVVVLGLLEVGFQWPFKHLFTIYSPTGEDASLVNRDDVVIGADDDAVRGFFQCWCNAVMNPHAFGLLR